MTNYQIEHIENKSKFNLVTVLIAIILLGFGGILMFPVIIISALYEPIKLLIERVIHSWSKSRKNSS